MGDYSIDRGFTLSCFLKRGPLNIALARGNWDGEEARNSTTRLLPEGGKDKIKGAASATPEFVGVPSGIRTRVTALKE